MDNIIAPDILKNLFSCDDLIFIFDKTFQQFSFSGCKVYLSVGRNSKILVELNCIGTKFKFTKFYRFSPRRFPKLLTLSKKLFQIKGFCQIIIGAKFEPQNSILNSIPCFETMMIFVCWSTSLIFYKFQAHQ